MSPPVRSALLIEEGGCMNDARINQPYSLLRFVFGVVPIVAGLDKFTNLLTDWRQYLSPVLAGMLPLSPATFMHVVGVIEIAAGVIVLTRLVRIGAFIVAAWLACIAL